MTSPDGVSTTKVYSDSQRSFRPSPSVSLMLGLVPNSISSVLVKPSLSGSPNGPLSGLGKVSFCSPVSSSLSGGVIGISSIMGSPLSRGSRPLAISHPSSSPSPSVSASLQSVPYRVCSILSGSPSPSWSCPPM